MSNIDGWLSFRYGDNEYGKVRLEYLNKEEVKLEELTVKECYLKRNLQTKFIELTIKYLGERRYKKLFLKPFIKEEPIPEGFSIVKDKDNIIITILTD